MRINHLQYIPIALHSSVYGKNMSDEELANKLSTIDCGILTAILCRLFSLHIAICEGNQDAEKLYSMLRFFHAQHIIKQGGDSKKYCAYESIMCPTSLLLLEKWALVHCRVEAEISQITVPDLCLIMDLLLAVNDKMPKGEVKGHETEHLYLMLYYHTHRSLRNQLARAYYVYGTLAKSCSAMAKIIQEYEEKKGFTIEERICILFNSLSLFMPMQYTFENVFAQGLCVQKKEFDARGLNKAYKSITHDVCITYSQMKKMVAKTLYQTWNFEPFYRHPFVYIGNNQFAISETAIIYQIWEGLYWSVRFSSDSNNTDFFGAFGKPFEQYIQEITSEAVRRTNGMAQYFGEFFYTFNGNRKASSDCYFIIDDTLIAVEVKAKSPHSDTLTGINREAILSEVDDLIVNPVNQVIARTKELFSTNCHMEGISDNAFKDIKQLIILSVSMEKVQPIGELLFYSDGKITPNISGISMVAYHNLSAEDYEAVCNVLESKPRELKQILVSWFHDQRKDRFSAVLLANYLYSNDIPYTCSAYVDSLFSNSLHEISIQTFGYDILNSETESS